MEKRILVLSYYSNVEDSCQAEWVDDRINAFIEKGYEITLVSSILAKKSENLNINHYRIPSLSPNSFEHEFNEIRKRKLVYGATQMLFFKIYYKLTQSIKFILTKLGFSFGEGRWSWFPLSSLFCLFLFSNRKVEFIYTTGGPASPHLTGILISKIYRKKIICELQDPLSGKDIGRNQFSAKGLAFMENLIIKYSSVTIYCTRNATIFAKERYKQFKDKIDYVYPGSTKVKKQITEINAVKDSEKINITYLGSLYQTRNIDSLMKAIELLNDENKKSIEINLYGHLNEDIKNRIDKFEKGIIKYHGMVPRNIALQKGQDSDILLLVQHSDDRSITTMPFKTYDYLHSNKLILGLVYRNDEIEEILKSHGHLVCQVDDVDSIKEVLLNIISNLDIINKNILDCELTPEAAVNRMLLIMKKQ